jgi:hypothetical protein
MKSMLTSEAIYPLTALAPPKGIMMAIMKIEQAYLWVVAHKVFRGNVRKNVMRFAVLKPWVGLAFWTSRNLQEL